MALVRWRFVDPVSMENYEFEINPSSGGSPGFQKTFSYAETSAPDGKTLVFEGRPAVQYLEFSGRLLSKAQYDAFVLWWEKKYQVQVIDDLNRTFWIIFETFNPTRVRRRSNPWLHDYQVKAIIVNWGASGGDES